VSVAWIVNHYAGGPGIGTGWRHWELGRRWAREGLSVRIFAASTRIGGTTGPGRNGDREVDGVRYSFVQVPEYRGNGAGRAMNMLAFARGSAVAMRRAASAGERPAVVIASSPQPLVWPGAAAAARRHGVPFVPDIRDAWPESLRDLAGCGPLNPLVLASRFALRTALRNAALVMSPLPNIALHLADHGFGGLPFIHVPNGITMPVEDSAVLPEEAGRAVAEARSQGRRIALYAGAMGRPNALADLMQAAELLPEGERARLAFLMVGAGTERIALEAGSKRVLPATFRFLGELEQPVVQSLARRCDAGIVLRTRHEVYRFGTSPQKLPMYLACGLPAICSSTDPGDAVARDGLGWWVPAGDVRALADALAAFARLPDTERRALSAACEGHARRELEWDAISARALAALPRAGRR
jgi:glycosyltransferase involved in cell wall biosynthesis